MKRLIAVWLAAVLVVLGLSTSQPASADWSDCPKRLESNYTHLWHKVRRIHGKRAPGRNIRKYGVLFQYKDFPATRFLTTCGELRRSKRQLNELVHAPVLMYSTDVLPHQPPGGVKTDFNMAALPSCTWGPESGGDYGAYNPSSGAQGKYQVIPKTHASICPDLGWDPEGQETCAARIWKEQGSSAWVNC